jgi:hypothetical protein
MKHALIALALALSATQAHANSAKFCVSWADTSAEMFNLRKRGLNKEDVKELSTDVAPWTVAHEYALKHAFEANTKTDVEAFRMTKFRQCREDDV